MVDLTPSYCLISPKRADTPTNVRSACRLGELGGLSKVRFRRPAGRHGRVGLHNHD